MLDNHILFIKTLQTETSLYLKIILGNLRLACKVEIDCYNSHDKLQNTYIDMFNEEILTDFVIKVFSICFIQKLKK